jgi:hypothetical protein
MPEGTLEKKLTKDELISLGPIQPILASYPLTGNRKFSSHWFNAYKWLEYSKISDSVFCFYCRYFDVSSQNGHAAKFPFVSGGIKNWQKLGEKCKNHNLSESHINCEKAYKDWASEVDIRDNIREDQKKNALKKREEISKNREILASIIRGILFLARNGLALRGHRESKSSGVQMRGNFLELLDLISFYDETLKTHIEKGAGNAKYFSPEIQNELLAIIAEHIRERKLAIV